MNILLVEDEVNVSAFIKKGLEEHGYSVMQAYDGLTGLKLVEQYAYDLIILDIIVPHLSGLDLCQKIRELGFTEIPILMLTALGTTDDVVAGLDRGADDYLRKPFKFKELLARLRVLLRRKQLEKPGQKLRIADLEMDLDKKEVQRNGVPISLTAKEFTLLAYFVRNANKVVSR
ncbi:UNVERIFIED_CONTAM: hypothetical protein GTU68_037764, partial [Idotea baltica]|nr:hypothetical protein [Idotea baltica]